jgi:hypothetical protein
MVETPTTEVGDELVVDLLAGIDAAGGGAVLPGIVVAEGPQARDHGIDVGVVEDDDRGLAAEFEMRALDRLGRACSTFLPVATSPVIEIMLILRMVDQRVADALAAAEHDVDHALGQDVASSLASFSAVSGVCSDGLKTTVLPPAIAGASFQAIIISG